MRVSSLSAVVSVAALLISVAPLGSAFTASPCLPRSLGKSAYSQWAQKSKGATRPVLVRGSGALSLRAQVTKVVATLPSGLDKAAADVASSPGEKSVNPPLDASKLGSLRFSYPLNLGASAALEPSKSTKPLLLYIPGFDGTQMFAESQFKDLAAAYELRVLTIPGDDRLDFEGLVGAVSHYLEAWNKASKCSDKPTLLGESTGGLVSVGVALRSPKSLHSIVMVNPATSYQDTVWPILGRFLAAIPDIVPLGSQRLPSLLDMVNARSTMQDLGLLPDRSLGELVFAGIAAPILGLAAFDAYQVGKYASIAGSRAREIASGGIGRAPEDAIGLAKEAVDGEFATTPPTWEKRQAM